MVTLFPSHKLVIIMFIMIITTSIMNKTNNSVSINVTHVIIIIITSAEVGDEWATLY